jgi:hypothetical protein
MERPWFRKDDTAERNDMARKAYASLLILVRHRPDEAKHAAFSRQVKERAQKVSGTLPYPDAQVKDSDNYPALCCFLAVSVGGYCFRMKSFGLGIFFRTWTTVYELSTVLHVSLGSKCISNAMVKKCLRHVCGFVAESGRVFLALYEM